MNYLSLFNPDSYQSPFSKLELPTYPQVDLPPVGGQTSDDVSFERAYKELFNNHTVNIPTQELLSKWEAWDAASLIHPKMAQSIAHTYTPNSNRLDSYAMDRYQYNQQVPHNVPLNFMPPTFDDINSSHIRHPHKSTDCTDWETPVSQKISPIGHNNSEWSTHNVPENVVKQIPKELDDSPAFGHQHNQPSESLPYGHSRQYETAETAPVYPPLELMQHMPVTPSASVLPSRLDTQSQLPTPYIRQPHAATSYIYPAEPVSAYNPPCPSLANISSIHLQYPITPPINDQSPLPLYPANINPYTSFTDAPYTPPVNKHFTPVNIQPSRYPAVAQHGTHPTHSGSRTSPFLYPSTPIIQNIPFVPSMTPPDLSSLSPTHPSSSYLITPPNDTRPLAPPMIVPSSPVSHHVTPTKKRTHTSKKPAPKPTSAPPASRPASHPPVASSSQEQPKIGKRRPNGRVDPVSQDILNQYYSAEDRCQLCLSQTRHRRPDRKLEHLVSSHICQAAKNVEVYDREYFLNNLNVHGRPADLVVTEEQYNYARAVIEQVKCPICTTETSLVFRVETVKRHLDNLHSGLNDNGRNAEIDRVKGMEKASRKESWYSFCDAVLYNLPL